MSDTVIEQPNAGWYPDPSSDAPFRWWDGARWSTRTTQDPAADAIAPLVIPAPASLPSRRSLRESPTAMATATAVTTAPVPASPVSAAYVPLNPLGGPPPAPELPSAPDWQTPDAWVANSPAGAFSDHAVYGTGAPFASTIQPEPAVQRLNTFANLGAGFAVIGLLYQGVVAVWGPSSATSDAGLAVAAALIAGIVCGMLGLTRARRFAATGSRPRRAPGLLVVLVCALAIAAQGAVASGVVDGLDLSATGNSTSSVLNPPAPTSVAHGSGAASGSTATTGASK